MEDQYIEIETVLGKIRGCKMEDGTVQFRGLRYATAERWKYPVRCGEWSGIYDATAFGAACPQNRSFFPEKEDSFYYREFRKDLKFQYNEDCLFLNIYVPEHAILGMINGLKDHDSFGKEGLPVVLYIHGGAFMGGCAHERHMDGSAYAKRGIIFVSIHYRLGPLGFASAEALKKESGHTGNYGLYDQLAALQWVYDYIKYFGGDSERMTLFGQSAGAMSVQQLCLSPLSKPMIYAAYMASGGGIGKEFAAVHMQAESMIYWEPMFRALGKTPDEWRCRPVEEVYQALKLLDGSSLLRHCCPTVDGIFIKDIPAAEQAADIPYLFSTNSEDMVPEILEKMAIDFCKKQLNAFYFRFERKLPGDNSGAFHSAELWYTMGTLAQCWRPMEELDYTISETLIDKIVSLSKCGDPRNGDVLWESVRNGGRLIVDESGLHPIKL